jgi:hypothetical protein
MKRTERVAIVIPVATVSRIGEQHIGMLIVTDPISAAISFGQILCLSAQPTFRFFFHRRGWLSWAFSEQSTQRHRRHSFSHLVS